MQLDYQVKMLFVLFLLFFAIFESDSFILDSLLPVPSLRNCVLLSAKLLKVFCLHEQSHRAALDWEPRGELFVADIK